MSSEQPPQVPPAAAPTTVPRRQRHRPTLPAIVVLTGVWVLLWGQPSIFLLLTGIVLAVLIGLIFPLPAIELHGRIRPVALLRLLGKLLFDVVVSSLAIVKLAFRRGDPPKSAIVRVRLRGHSDLYMTQTSELVSLVPGTLVMEARPSSDVIYVHVLDSVSPDDLDRIITEVRGAEERVIRAFGSRSEIDALDAEGGQSQ